MAENIFKVYPGGSWHNEGSAKRLDHVIKALDLYNSGYFDDRDLVWHIKNAVIGNIYFSEDVAVGVNSGLYWKGWQNQSKQYCNWIGRILNGNTRILNGQPTNTGGSFDESLLKIREYLNTNISGGNLRFEHIIPAKEYVGHLKGLKSGLNQQSFDIFRDKIGVCIVTREQDDVLNKAHLRESMPAAFWNAGGWNGGCIFERYNEVGIKIHGIHTPY